VLAVVDKIHAACADASTRPAARNPLLEMGVRRMPEPL
jgi:hypothetical protein